MTEHEKDDAFVLLSSALRDWDSYPSNLEHLQPIGRPKLIKDIQEQFQTTKSKVLKAPNSDSSPPGDTPLAEWLKSELGDKYELSPQSSETRSTTWFDSNFEHGVGLGNYLLLEKESDVNNDDGFESFLDIKDDFRAASPDPACRFILLHECRRSDRLNIDEELLLKILTFHQVSPHYLTFISSICFEKGVDNTRFSGFRCITSFSPSNDLTGAIPSLGRSGSRYELIFEMKAVMKPHDDDVMSISTSSSKEDSLGLWLITQSAIYHRFDVVTGRSLWIVTSDEDNSAFGNWEDMKNSLAGPDASRRKTTSSGDVERGFRSSLSVLVRLADWSLGEFRSYVTHLNAQMGSETSYFLNTRGSQYQQISAVDVRRLGNYMEALAECIAAIDSNLRVCRDLVKLYRNDLLTDGNLKHSGSPLVTLGRKSRPQPQASVNEDIDRFCDEMLSIRESMEELKRYARVVWEISTRREGSTFRIVSTKDTQYGLELNKVTFFFSKFTLVLLPVSVVTGIFSTELVKFRDGGITFAGSWSSAAITWWLCLSVAATVFVWFIARNHYPQVEKSTAKERLRKYRDRAKYGYNKVCDGVYLARYRVVALLQDLNGVAAELWKMVIEIWNRLCCPRGDPDIEEAGLSSNNRVEDDRESMGKLQHEVTCSTSRGVSEP